MKRERAASSSKLLVVVVLLLLRSSVASAGPWTRDQYHFYLQLGTSFSFAEDRYDINGNLGPIEVRKFSPAIGRLDVNKSNYQQLLSDFYFEFGLVKRLTIFGDIPFISARQMNEGGDLNYSSNKFGDILLGARYGILNGEPFALGLETRLVFPSGNSQIILPTGSGDFRGELRLAAAKTLPWVPIYFDFEFGFTLRGSATVIDQLAPSGTSLARYAPELVLHGEVGGPLVRWRQVDRLILSFYVDYRGSTQRSNVADATFSIIPENSEFTTISVQVLWYAYHGLGINARFTQAVEGRRLPHTSTVAGALYAEW